MTRAFPQENGSHDLGGEAMKITIELDGFALRVLTAVSLSAWAIFGGGAGVVSGAISLYLILKG